MPGVRAALAGSLDSVHLTLDALSSGLEAELAAHLGVQPEQVVAGAGSGALLAQFMTAHAGPGDAVVHSWPSFEVYPLLISTSGARAIAVPAPDDRQDLAAVAAAVTPATTVVLLCNPNNPTGEVLGAPALRELLDALPPHVVLLVDEAYREFAEPGSIADALELAATDDRVAVVRTFSKSHGLLGARVGYLVGSRRVVDPLRPSTIFYRVPTPAQAAAVVALRAEDAMRAQCTQVAAERDRVRRGLLDLGFDVPPSGGNFLWVRLGERNDEFVAHLAEHGIAVRALAGGAGVRVSTGTREADDAVLDAAKQFPR
ncbi:aspartate aminotransferase [Actinokineospora bangkokensis]|uniref:Aspartate aminotransferase n=1 Tax=Actinokineospora bangkokensis TaxID=1193682 RepID=A0A1Q9LPG9_9PSEU|nr:aspartate aminotransferase [Actinokineospora bangkokensis]